MKTKRVFIAFKLPRKGIDNISKSHKVLRKMEGLKLIPRENIHLTLEFLGDLEENQINKVITSLDKLFTDDVKFEATFGDNIFFPSPQKPRVVSIELNSEFLIDEMQKKIRASLTKLKFLELDKRSFIPHITVARVVSPGLDKNDIDKIITTEYEYDEFTLNKIHVIESELKKSGPVYKIIKEYKLQNATE